MSVIHDMINEVEVKEKVQTTPWARREPVRSGGLFVFDLPNEILNDFYDLKEYIRIANKQGDMKVLSIASASSGEGSSTIATYLSFLMSGGMAKKIENQFAEEKSVQPQSTAGEKNQMIFNDEFSALATDSNCENDSYSEVIEQDAIDPDEDILLIDANLHQPSLHKYFGLEAENGLADIVANNLNWRRMAKTVHDSKLRVITAGHSQMNPVELLSSQTFYELVAEWRETFKYVIFDSSPVLQYVDSMSLASVVDGVVLVVKAGQTRWELAQHAKTKLANAHATLLGVALNRRKMDIPDGLYKRLMV